MNKEQATNALTTVAEAPLLDLSDFALNPDPRETDADLPAPVNTPAGAKQVVSIFDAFRVDPDKSENGAWFEDILSPTLPGVNLKVRRIDSKHSDAVKRRIDKALGHRADKNGQYPEDVYQTVLVNWIGQSLLADWSGVLDQNGHEIPFSTSNAIKVLNAVPQVRAIIFGLANTMPAFRAQKIAEIEGN